MQAFLRTLFAVVPMFLVWTYVRGQSWGTPRLRNIAGFILGLAWAIAFGAFCGATGFLRN